MNDLYIGFSRADITGKCGLPIAGYYVSRISDGVLDELTAAVLAIKLRSETMLMISVDNLEISTPASNSIRKEISKKAGIPQKSIFLHCTHTHTAPYGDTVEALKFEPDLGREELERIEEYHRFLTEKLVGISVCAIEDLKPSKVGYAINRAQNIAFLRRYRMKDGSVATNPGINNPNIVSPSGELDESVNVIRFSRQDGEDIALVNFANHPDTVGGNKLSADWPGFLRKTLERALDNTKCIFFNGAQGDVNHINVRPTKGFLNDLSVDFDDVVRGYGHARHIGNSVAGAVLQVWDKVEYTDIEKISSVEKIISVPSNKATKEELKNAYAINELCIRNRQNELPYKGMELTTVTAEAQRMIRLENAPDAFEMTLCGFCIGKIAFIGIPGEPFNSIGTRLKQTDKWDLVIPCCLTNGSEGYFPVRDAYNEGGYESRSSIFKAGVDDVICDGGKKMLDELSES